MRRATPRPTALALCALAALALSACGGSASSTTSTGSSASSAAQGATATSSPSAAKATQTPHSPSTHQGSPPFRVKGGDNSIPNFGSEAAGAERKRATVAITAYLKADAAGDWPLACSYLAAPTRTQLESLAKASKGKIKGCAGILGALELHTPPAARAATASHGLAALRLKGTRAFALYYGPHNQQYMMPMSEEGGAWKVTQLAPLAYPLDSQSPSTSSQAPASP